MTSSQYANHTYFRQNHSLRVKQKNKDKSGTQTGVNVVNYFQRKLVLSGH